MRFLNYFFSESGHKGTTNSNTNQINMKLFFYYYFILPANDKKIKVIRSEGEMINSLQLRLFCENKWGGNAGVKIDKVEFG